MDVQQVNSRVIHEEPDTVYRLEPDLNTSSSEKPDRTNNTTTTTTTNHASPDADGGQVERQVTALSAASFEEPYPEGGWAAWSVVLGSFLALFSAMGLMNSIALFQAYVLEHQLRGRSEGTVGWIFSIYTFLAFFGGVYFGPVFDKYGPRWLTIAGGACVTSSMVAMSFCTDLWHFILAFGVLGGLGTSLVFTPCIAAVGHWFKRRRGFATGLATCAGGLGGIIFPLMLSDLFPRIGYAWATRALALVCLVCSFLGVLLVRARLPPAPDATARPDPRIFRQLPFALATAGIFLLEFALFIPLAYVSTYAVHRGFGQAFAFHLIPVMNAGSVVGRSLPGYYSDVIGALNTCLLSVVLSLVACWCVWLPLGHTTGGIVVFSVLFGFASGTGIAIAPVCIGRMCKTQEYGRYYATTYTVVSFACLIGIPIAGSIVQANGGEYGQLIICTGCMYVGSAGFLIWAKAAKLGWKNWLAAY
ncbi:Major facilitator superfamily domain, general substrate transporter [Cordyceps fumosorosea ARSEF 2679]|uniref:Major facilitator superfamily domain, general substrate transporter n=1 Tax=Cordyceps fumosorosea (strain ARSEF 2679) TaxID=1081104 RepID=A0A167NLT9_CORFA|nr:Major facilitator superfamily domain, general substrate transporter [Cordyceps fumosorosea ARSEF 2679]OAA55697.1 Major facilitator superfamily domain, general substrate transporter [Cordyceps fumosorosea ARSEF 2679]